MTAMKKWAREEGVQIEEDFMLEKQWFTDLLAGDFTRGEPCATEHNISRGMSPQWLLPVSFDYKRLKEDEEQAADSTEGTRTLAERLELQSVGLRPPPETLEELKLLVTTCAALLFVLFGNGCDLYKKMMGIYVELKSAASNRVKKILPILTIRQWYWEICQDWRRYFHQRCMVSDFEGGVLPLFPSSTLQTLVPYVTRGVGIGNITFPPKWNTNATQPPLRYTNPVAQQAPVYHQYTLPPPPNVPTPQAFDDGTKTSGGGKKKPAAKKQKTGTFDLSSLHKIVQTAFQVSQPLRRRGNFE